MTGLYSSPQLNFL